MQEARGKKQEAGSRRREAGGRMKYEEWLVSVPDSLKQDSLWQFHVYPMVVFLYDLLWEDCEGLVKDVRGRALPNRSFAAASRLGPTWRRGSDAGSAPSLAIFCAWRLARLVRRAAGITVLAACSSLRSLNI